MASATAGPSAAGGRRPCEQTSDGIDKHHLKWIAAFETGSAEIDAAHRKLVRDCNSLLLLVENNAAWSLIVADARKLVEECIEHFRLEESVLEQTGFPRCREHAIEHRRMEAVMQELLARIAQLDGSQTEHREHPKLLGPILVDLIIRQDLDFRSHLLHRQGR